MATTDPLYIIATSDRCVFADDESMANATAQTIGGQVYEAHLVADYSSGFDLLVPPAIHISNLKEDVARLKMLLDTAHRDAEVLAAGENERRANIEGFTPYPALEAVRCSRDDLSAAMERSARRVGGF